MGGVGKLERGKPSTGRVQWGTAGLFVTVYDTTHAAVVCVGPTSVFAQDVPERLGGFTGERSFSKSVGQEVGK